MQAELEDRVKQTCHAALKTAAEDLAVAAGNYHHRLSERARRLLAAVDKPFEELDLLRLHIELERFRTVLETRGERAAGDELSADEIEALEAIQTLGPPLVRDNADVEVFEARRREEEDEPEPGPEALEAEKALAGAIKDSPEIMGDNLRGIAEVTQDAPPETKAGYARHITVWKYAQGCRTVRRWRHCRRTA